MRNRLLKSFTAVMACCMVMAFATPSFAQWGGWPRQGVRTRTNVDRLIRQAESRSNVFVNTFDRALDNSRLEGTFREDRLNAQAAQLERELNVARQQLNRSASYVSIRNRIANALSMAQGINTAMRNRRLRPQVERQWVLLRSDLNRLAAAFDLRQVR